MPQHDAPSTIASVLIEWDGGWATSDSYVEAEAFCAAALKDWEREGERGERSDFSVGPNEPDDAEERIIVQPIYHHGDDFSAYVEVDQRVIGKAQQREGGGFDLTLYPSDPAAPEQAIGGVGSLDEAVATILQKGER